MPKNKILHANKYDVLYVQNNKFAHVDKNNNMFIIVRVLFMQPISSDSLFVQSDNDIIINNNIFVPKKVYLMIYIKKFILTAW